MATPEVYCAFNQMVPVNELKPNPDNPNTHPKSQIRLLSKIIVEQGWRAPITVSNRSGLMTRGHGRLDAALLAGLTECPVDFQDYDSAESELADMLADNRIAELSVMNIATLEVNKGLLDAAGFDLELAGFEEIDGEEGSGSEKDSEIDIDSLDETMTIKLKYGEDDYVLVKQKLEEISEDFSFAVKKLLDV